MYLAAVIVIWPVVDASCTLALQLEMGNIQRRGIPFENVEATSGGRCGSRLTYHIIIQVLASAGSPDK